MSSWSLVLLAVVSGFGCGGVAVTPSGDAGSQDAPAAGDAAQDGGGEPYLQCGTQKCGAGTFCTIDTYSNAPAQESCVLATCTSCGCMVFLPECKCSQDAAGVATLTCNW